MGIQPVEKVAVGAIRGRRNYILFTFYILKGKVSNVNSKASISTILVSGVRLGIQICRPDSVLQEFKENIKIISITLYISAHHHVRLN